MTDRVTIAAEPRTVTGKKVKQLRRQGMVPGIIYGQAEPVNIQMEEIQLNRALRVAGTTQLATVDVEGKAYTVLAREIQQHVTRRNVLHIDFMEVDMKVTITSVADLVLVGESPALELEEGMIAQAMYNVDIECLPDALISQIEVDISAIKTPGDRIQVSDPSYRKALPFWPMLIQRSQTSNQSVLRLRKRKKRASWMISMLPMWK